jgi:hypothetical protein
MERDEPDLHGPLSPAYFHTWFENRLLKAVDFGQQKVCFKRLVTIAEPGVPWLWNDGSRTNECSMQAASPLYQSFSYYVRKSVIKGLNIVGGLNPPPSDHVHIVLEVRKVLRGKKAGTTSRLITNLDEIIASLRNIPNVMVTAMDFASLPLVEQIKLAHSASVLVGMHGAGNVHMIHMAVGHKNCCGFLEMFPGSGEFSHLQMYQNLARHLGVHARRYDAKREHTTAIGTQLDVAVITSMVSELVKKVGSQPSCLHEVRDL